MDRWNNQFGQSQIAQQQDVVHCYLNSSHGVSDAAKLRDVFAPGSETCKSVIPAIAKDIDNFQSFGHTPFFLSSDFEFLMLASLRMQYVGQTQVVMMPVADAKRLLEVQGIAIDLNALRACPLNLTADLITKCKQEKLTVVTATVEPLSILHVPAGWIVAQTTVGGDSETCKVSGLRVSFISKRKDALQAAVTQLEIVKKTSGSNDKLAQDLLDIATSELACHK
jgi:hypothetical protein